MRQGGAGTDFFIIQEGTVKCTQTKASGREVELITLMSGDYFGEMALLLNELRAANCIAVGNVKCLSLDREKFDMLLGSAQEVRIDVGVTCDSIYLYFISTVFSAEWFM